MGFVVSGALLLSQLSSHWGWWGSAKGLFRTPGELLAHDRYLQSHHGFHMAVIAVASIKLVGGKKS